MPHWRKTTWVLVIWTVIMALWMVGGLANAGNVSAQNCGTDTTGLCQAGVGLGTGLGITMLFFLWAIVAIILAVIWFATRPKDNVTVYGPQGQQVTTSEKDAAKRVAQGWSYTKPESTSTPQTQ